MVPTVFTVRAADPVYRIVAFYSSRQMPNHVFSGLFEVIIGHS
jgi:hypothetical protein